jgi:UvrD-like helicase family protein/nuclease-like protein
MAVGDAGRSAWYEAEDAAGLVRDLEAELRRAYARQSGFEAAAFSEPRTALALRPLEDRGWRVFHDRRWPGSTRANVDHVVVGPPGVIVVDTKHWAGPVEVRNGRLCACEEDRHDAVEDLLRLVTSVEDLLLDLGTGPDGQPVGLSAVHVVPVLAFTSFSGARRADTRLGRIRLTAVPQLPALLAAQSTVLSAGEIARVADRLDEQMPPAVRVPVPRQRGSVLGVPVRPEPLPDDPGAEPDALFDVPDLAEQLAKAASAPLVKWMGFLHPGQTRLVRRSYTGPARVRGPAGTGKSVVMLHRAAWLAETRPGRILVTSFVRTLPIHQRAVYEQLSPTTVDRVDFLGLHAVAKRVLADAGRRMNVVGRRVDAAFDAAWSRAGADGPLADIAAPQYWRQEIDFVIKGRGLRSFVDYEALPRRGRSISLTPQERKPVWRLLSAYDEELERRRVHDFNDLLSAAVNLVARCGSRSPWAAVMIDEVQDLPLIGVRLCALLGGTGPDGLFLVGDGQQAIYPGGFTLAEAGVSVVGRATILQVNYRNTRQILDYARIQVDGDEFSDLDGTDEHGIREVEVLREGGTPTCVTAPDRWRLALLLAMAVRRDAAAGVDWGEMAVLTMSRGDAAFLRDQLASRDVPVGDLESWDGRPDHRVKVDTVQRAKGLDFTAVYTPILWRSATPGTEEREILRRRQQFVGQTRARDRLWVGMVTTSPQERRSEPALPSSFSAQSASA